MLYLTLKRPIQHPKTHALNRFLVRVTQNYNGAMLKTQITLCSYVPNPNELRYAHTPNNIRCYGRRINHYYCGALYIQPFFNALVSSYFFFKLLVLRKAILPFLQTCITRADPFRIRRVFRLGMPTAFSGWMPSFNTG